MAIIAIARMTVANQARQGVTWLLTGLSLGLLLLTWLFGVFNFHDQDRIRMQCTAGVAVAIINGLLLGVLGASQAVHDELASRTALGLFAKPITRGEFLLGKALGIWLAVLACTVVIAGGHVLALYGSLNWGFSGENAAPEAGLWVPWGRVLVAHGMATVQGAMLVSLAVVLACRVGLIANIALCLAFWVLGNVLAGFGWDGGMVVPAFGLFNMDDNLQFQDVMVNYVNLGLLMLYAALWCAGILWIGLALLERQDIS